MDTISYTVVLSRRKTIALHTKNGELEVRAPIGATTDDIEEFILEKLDWVVKNLATSKRNAELRERFSVNYGDTVTYLGREYPVAAKAGDWIGFDDKSFYLPPGLHPIDIKTSCVEIYRMLARRDLNKKVREFSEVLHVEPTGVKITSAKNRWGSCTWRKSLNFSWRLIMAHEDCVNYVVVHELAHLIEMNHGKQFWRIVESVIPNYMDLRPRLKKLYSRLLCENW